MPDKRPILDYAARRPRQKRSSDLWAGVLGLILSAFVLFIATAMILGLVADLRYDPRHVVADVLRAGIPTVFGLWLVWQSVRCITRSGNPNGGHQGEQQH